MLGVPGAVWTAAGVTHPLGADHGGSLDLVPTRVHQPEIDRALKANLQLAEALDIRGTPGFVIGDEIVPGAIDLETLKGLIAAARRK